MGFSVFDENGLVAVVATEETANDLAAHLRGYYLNEKGEKVLGTIQGAYA